MRYTRPRLSTFSEMMLSPSFFVSAPAKVLLTVCGCQPVYVESLIVNGLRRDSKSKEHQKGLIEP